MTPRSPDTVHGLDPVSSVALARRVAHALLTERAVELGEPVWQSIKPSVEALLGGGDDQSALREWHAFLLDLHSILKDLVPAVADDVARIARDVRAAVTLARRSPPEEAMQRPASRRLLMLVAELGGAECPLTSLAERMRVSASHLANIARPLISHGLLRRTKNEMDGRQGLLSLTDAGRRAIESDRHSRERATKFREAMTIVDSSEGKPAFQATTFIHTSVNAQFMAHSG